MTRRDRLPGSTVSGTVTWPTLVRMLEAMRGEQKIVVTYYGEAESDDGRRTALYHVILESAVPFEAFAHALIAPNPGPSPDANREGEARDEEVPGRGPTNPSSGPGTGPAQ